jgi:Fumarylacetoacetase N-terminal domain 2
MKLATLENGARDGRLVVVSRDLKRAVDAAAAAPTFLSALTGGAASRGRRGWLPSRSRGRQTRRGWFLLAWCRQERVLRLRWRRGRKRMRGSVAPTTGNAGKPSPLTVAMSTTNTALPHRPW